jgi:hypothetical protein
MAQIFVGRKSLVIDVFGMKTEKEFVNTLENVIRRRGAMDKLISDSAITELSARVMDILIFYAHFASTTGKVNLIINTKTLLNIAGTIVSD